MEFARFWLLTPLLALAGCQSSVPAYAPPAQRTPAAEIPLSGPPQLVWLSAPGAKPFVARDVNLEDAFEVWYWAGPRPAVRVRPKTDQGLSYVIEFLLTDEAMAQTGPVTITYSIDDHVLDRRAYASPGHYFFKEAVPRDWLKPGQDAIVSAESDRPFRHDGIESAFRLSSLGLLAE